MPRGSNGHALAYDAARGVTVLFGGKNSDGVLSGETWEWNGVAWIRRQVLGPSPRYLHAMAFDSTRRVTVLFGGLVGTEANGETWEWDGDAWTRRMVPGPSPRSGHAMAYDAARGVTVLVGGLGGGVSTETWEWNGQSWIQRDVNGPPTNLSLHALAFDPHRGVTTLFGGLDDQNNVAVGETWEWDGTSWSQRLVPGPVARFSHTMLYDTARGVTLLVGGRSAGTLSDYYDGTWEWDGSAWTLRTQGGPAPCAGAAAAFDSRRGVTMHFGGYQDDFFFGGTWEWDGTSWTTPLVGRPAAPVGVAMAYDSARAVSIAFGGHTTLPAVSGETWEWQGFTWVHLSGHGPSGRTNAAMAFDAGRAVAVLFGGYSLPGGNEHYDDSTWEWNGSAWTERIGPGPSGRQGHSMAYDAARGVTVLFGGRRASIPGVPNAETWVWDGAAWTMLPVNGPSARSDHAMAYDAARAETVLFGGVTEAGLSDQLWIWNGAGWTPRITPGPPALRQHAMAYDAARRVVVLQGGATTTEATSGLTWEWDGTAWDSVASGPRLRQHAMSYDHRLATTVVFGGSDPGWGPVTRTWEFREPCSSPIITTQPTHLTVCANSEARLYAAAYSYSVSTYQWHSGMPPIPIVGATSSTLIVPAATVSDEGTFVCTISNVCGSISTVAAPLTVCISDFNCDGGVDGSDVEAFFLPWEAGDSSSDVNNDGGVDGGDVELFLTRWEAGC